jgi:hypothetical protein
MTTTLITGSNKGLGYETARQLVAAGQAQRSSSGWLRSARTVPPAGTSRPAARGPGSPA